MSLTYLVATDRIDAHTEVLCAADAVVALTSSAMECLARHQIPFLSPELAYPWADLEQDFGAMERAASQLLGDLDALTAPLSGFERPFSSNGFWFLVRFSNLHYLCTLARRLCARYERIQILTDAPIMAPAPVTADFCSLTLPTLGGGLPYALRLLTELTGAQVEVVPGALASGNGWRRESWLSLLRRSPNIALRRSCALLRRTARTLLKKRGAFLVVQGGYDVEVLRSECREYEFIDPMRPLAVEAASGEVSADLREITPDLQARVTHFASSHLPGFEVPLRQLCEDYARNVVSRIPSSRRAIDAAFTRIAPRALLLSKGAETLLEHLVCQAAVTRHIPIYAFKHGGPENLFAAPIERDRYFERNPFLKRIQFLHSSVELPLYEATSVRPVVIGRLERLAGKPLAKRRYGRRLLYSMGAPAHSNYKDAVVVISDWERWVFATTLIKECARLDIGIDIKPHPVEWQWGTRLVELLIASVGAAEGRIRLLEGGSIERRITEYGGIVLDDLRTKVLSGVLTLDVPTILYLPRRLTLNPTIQGDLEARVHRVIEPNTLRPLLEAFRLHRLPSRWSNQFFECYFGDTDSTRVVAKIRQLVCADTPQEVA